MTDLPPHARSTDPLTSHEAVPRNITAQGILILHAYNLAGYPILDVDAYRIAGFGPTARDGQRCSDLRYLGYIERTGEREKTPSGKFGYLCVITPKGLSYLENLKR